MTTDSPNNEAPEPQQAKMSHSTSTSSDSRKMETNSPARTSQGLLIGSVIHFANGDLTVSSDTMFETPEERGARLVISRQLESQRLKERLSQIPWHAKRAAKEGEAYWLRLAASYQGN